MVRFEMADVIQDIVYCHCSLCRKAQGGAFATNANVNTDEFLFISGEDRLTAYQSSAGQTKYFCSHCGSPVISKNTSAPEKVRIRLGTIESDITERPRSHIFAASKANWDEITDDLPQYDSYQTD